MSTVILTQTDSTPAVEATWKEYSERRGLDLTEVLQSKLVSRCAYLAINEHQPLMVCEL